MIIRFMFSLLVSIAFFNNANNANAASDVGVAGATNTNAFGTPPTKPKRLITLGDNIFFNEHITTDENGLLQILLKDGSTFAMGPSSDLVIDKFIYNPDTEIGEIAATLAKGTLRFIGGRISKAQESVKVTTPNATIGIRGGIMLLTQPAGEGEAEYSFHYGVAMDVVLHGGRSFHITKAGQSVRLQVTNQRKVKSAKKGNASKKHIKKAKILKGNKNQAGGKKLKKKTIGQIVRRLGAGNIQLLTSPVSTLTNKNALRIRPVAQSTNKRKRRRKRRRRRKF